MKPILEEYPNPLTKGWDKATVGSYYTHYEVQSVRTYQAPDGEQFCEPCLDEESMGDDEETAVGPPFVTIFGKLNDAGREALIDCTTLEQAHEVLERMGVKQ